MNIIQAHKFYFLKGGAERYMLDVSAWLEARGDTVIPFAMQHPDSLATPYSRYFPSFVYTEKPKISWQGLRTVGRMIYSREARSKMRRLITDTKPDLCHIHSIYNQISPSILRALMKEKIPVVMTVHDHHLVSPQYNIYAQGCGDDLRDASLIRASFSRFHKDSLLASGVQTFVFKLHRALGMYRNNIDLFITPSRYMKQQLVRGGFDQSKIRVNPYGIDLRSIESSFQHKNYFLYVGRLSEEKGVGTIIQLAKLLPDLQFKIVGRGPDMDRLHAMGDGLNNLEFLGFRVGDELRRLYQGATAVLLPSRVHENFPLVCLEAMAAGKPLIASEVGGIPEVVEDRVTGILVAPTDLSAWTEAVMRFAYDDDLTRDMSEAARQRVQQHFRMKDHFNRLMAIYQEVTPTYIN